MYQLYDTFLQHHPVTSTTRRDQAAGSPPQFRIALYFSCQPIATLFVLNQEHPDEPELVRRLPSLKMIRVVLLDLRQFLDHKKARQIIGDKLRSLHLGSTVRRRWVDLALETTREVVGSMPAQHNAVTIISRATFYVDFIDDHMVPAAEENNNYMVPAAESWIVQTLGKKMTLKEYSGDLTCAVCLEDFSGGGCEVVSMPCKHYFHGECIGKWLRTSHYCPVCRFNVPTELDLSNAAMSQSGTKEENWS